MNPITTIGICGNGFVGSAVVAGFTNGRTNVVISDPCLGTNTQTVIAANPSVVFVTVPTPMGADGVVDASIVDQVLTELSVLPHALLILKSTVTPDIADALSRKYPNFVYNPEFLTERNALSDFLAPQFHVFGGSVANCRRAIQVYDTLSNCAPCPNKIVTAKEASFIKYGVNSFLAAKVLFWNQFSDLCEKHGATYGAVIDVIGMDPRIGRSHSAVPGHDGRKGSAGPCFAKDVPALVQFSNQDLTVLREAWNTNCDYRNAYANRLQREVEQNIEFNKI